MCIWIYIYICTISETISRLHTDIYIYTCTRHILWYNGILYFSNTCSFWFVQKRRCQHVSSSDWNFRGGMTARYVCLVKSTLVRSAICGQICRTTFYSRYGPSKVSRLFKLNPPIFGQRCSGCPGCHRSFAGQCVGLVGPLRVTWTGLEEVCAWCCVCVLVLVCYPLNYQFDVVLIHHECRSLTGTLGVCSIVFCMFAIYPRVKTEMNATKLSLSPRSESTLATWSPSMWQAWSVPLGETVSVVLCYHWLPSFNIEVPIICVYIHIYIYIYYLYMYTYTHVLFQFGRVN